MQIIEVEAQSTTTPAAFSVPVSTMRVDPNVTFWPHGHIAGDSHAVEQSGEFVCRYFHAEVKPYPTLGQPYFFLMTGKDPAGHMHPAFERVPNGMSTPSVGGDMHVARGHRSGEVHTALITRVDETEVTVLQAHVPLTVLGVDLNFVGLSRYVLNFVGLSRYVLNFVGLSRFVLNCVGLSRYVLNCVGLSRYVLNFVGLSRYVLNFVGLSRYVLNFVGLSRYVLN
ncbi:MAG: hypothetical protein EB084_19380, partial [Proteobacteria bacterium]|nr:hypothetical protein [Pseudomonadota bacterium]